MRSPRKAIFFQLDVHERIEKAARESGRTLASEVGRHYKE